MPLIGSEAGVVFETVYRAFASKGGLFQGRNHRAACAAGERSLDGTVIEELDPRRQIELYAARSRASIGGPA